MRLLILSTPKTGKVWLKSLLSVLYDLPIATLPVGLDIPALDGMGPRWVGHQHFLPGKALLEWIGKAGVRTFTTVRHPCDVLVSYKQFMHVFPKAREVDPAAYEMTRDGETMGAATLAWVKNYFAGQLNLSMLWARVGVRLVRYEALTHEPVGTVTALANEISPVAAERIRAAVALSSIDRLRKESVATEYHFQKGAVGGWRERVSPEVQEYLRTTAPFPELFAAMGYSMEAPAGAARAKFSYDRVDPFGKAGKFDNGVGAPSAILRLYLLHIPRATERWAEAAKTGPGSFYEWLNAPCEESAHLPGPLVTNLLYQLYQSRPDLIAAFPDGLGKDRLDLCQWFLYRAPYELNLPPEFLAGMHASLASAEAPVMVTETPGEARGKLEAVSAGNLRNEHQARFMAGDVMELQVTARAVRPLGAPVIGVMLKSAVGACMYRTSTRELGVTARALGAGEALTLRVRIRLNVPPGKYGVELNWVNPEADGTLSTVHALQEAAMVEVVSRNMGSGLTYCDVECKVT